jgi:hypothetical protein
LADNRFFIPSTSLKELSNHGEYNRFDSAHELASDGERKQGRLHTTCASWLVGCDDSRKGLTVWKRDLPPLCDS